MNGKKYTFIEHTADIAFKAWGSTIENAFKNAAVALTNVITDSSKIQKKETKKISLEAKTKEDLLVHWLDELVYIFDVSQLIFSDFQIEISRGKEGWNLNAKAFGEPFSPTEHPSGTEVKGVSYHNLKIWKKDKKTYLQVILDV